MNKRNRISMAVSALLITGLLSACNAGGSNTTAQTIAPAQSSATEGGSSEAATSLDTQVSMAETADNSTPVTLRFMWWGGDSRHEATLSAIDTYTAAHPNVTIEAEYQAMDGYQQKLMTQISGGNQADIIQLDYVWFPDLARQGDLFLDLKAQSNIDLSGYSESFLADYCSINGTLISLPMGTNGFGLIMNKAFFEKHSLDPSQTFTWDSLIETAEKVNAEDSGDYLMSIESSSLTGMIFEPYILSNYGYYWLTDDSSAVRLTEEQLTETFTYMQKLFSTPGIQPLGEASLFASQMEQNPIWANNQLGFTIDWSGTLGKYSSVIGEDNLVVGKPPVSEGGQELIPTKPSMVISVSQLTSAPEVATDFINWMLTDNQAVEILGTQRSVPTNTNALAHLQEIGAVSEPMSQMVQQSMDQPAPAPPALAANSEVSEIVSNLLEEVAYKSVTPSDAAQQFIESVNSKIQELQS
ncbi:carbohydrate ABC transporter substrate-binding protein [Oscillospiraceae bacterium HV4-5-C5C]|nr:carbohydrate ABC transporter substrate-binding protein [Oscillospiraceae bacterium HV4-5-C5C]